MLSTAGQIVFVLLLAITVLATPLMAIENLPFRLALFLVTLIMLFLNFDEARGIALATRNSEISSKDEFALTLSLLTSVIAAIGVMAFLITKLVDKYFDYFWYRLLFFVGFGVIAFFPTVYLARTIAHA
jgi:hypothetical protein